MSRYTANLYLVLGFLAQLAVSCFHEIHARDPSYLTPSYIDHQVRVLQGRAASCNPLSKTKTALTNVRIFDGYTIHEASTIVIDGDVISLDRRGVNVTIDGHGGILLPGLIDSHCHIMALTDLEALSSYGVTTALSMNCQNYTLCQQLRNQAGLTSIFHAGIAAVAPNSTHARVFSIPGNPLVSSPAQAPQFVADVFSNGSDFMKIVSEANGFGPSTHNALVSATHALGKQAMTHAADLASYEVAIASKTDGLQHVPFDAPLTPALAAQMAAQRQFVTPTLNIGRVAANPVVATTFLGGRTNLTYEAGVASVRACKCAGVSILAGTDALTALAGLGDPLGLTLHRELENLVEAGLSNAEALRAATVVPARWHRLMDRGAVREGMRADLLLLKPGSNPLVNISQSRDIARVWNGGVEYKSLAAA